jgi:hypothetical protein
MRKTVGLLLFTFHSILSTPCAAQDLKMISGTCQETSGRLSSEKINHHSIGYHFYLSPVDKDIVFDSLYMTNIAIKLDQTPESRDFFYVHITVSNIYEIFVGNPPHLPTNNGQDDCPQRQFTGEGLIIYTCKGKTYATPIVNMKQLHPARIL